MSIDNILIVGNYREEFKDLSSGTNKIYNDHLSFNSINYIKAALNNLKIATTYFGGINELIDAYAKRKTFMKNVFFFNLSDGLEHENRKAQACILLELLNVKYIGSDANASIISANKSFAKSIVTENGVKSPRWKLIYSLDDLKDIDLNYPLIVKPNREGSSIGIDQENYILSYEALYSKVSKLILRFKELIVEEYIAGFEVTDFVIGNPNKFLMTEAVISGINNNFLYGKDNIWNKRKSLWFKTTDFGRKYFAKVHNSKPPRDLKENIYPTRYF